jgi:alanyl-tRNA synthetase
MKPEQIARVQSLANEKIRANLPVRTRHTSFRKAIDEGVIAFFGEKYGDEVRVVEAAENSHSFSSELCGGTHCSATGQIGSLIVVSETGIGAGMRRIEAVTGRGAEDYINRRNALLDDVSHKLGTSPDRIAARVESLMLELAEKERQIDSLERQRSQGSAEDYLARVEDIDGISVLATPTDATSVRFLRELGDMLKNRLTDSSIIVLSAVVDGEPKFIATVSHDLITRGIKAGDILSQVAARTGGSGGGRPDMAQGGGKDVGRVAEALREVPRLVREKLLASPK